MTREEASVLLKMMFAFWVNTHERTNVEMEMALNMALSALHPVSRERVEKLRGEWISAESDFDDDDTLFDVENWCDWQCSACHNEVCYDDPMERRWLPKFCPNCGTHMTDEAVQMVMERLEELHETV